MGKILDNVKFLLIAGSGLFGDGYLNITIGLVVPMIGYLYYEDKKKTVPTLPADIIKAGLSIGMIVGQLTFGLFGDAYVVRVSRSVQHSDDIAVLDGTRSMAKSSSLPSAVHSWSP